MVVDELMDLIIHSSIPELPSTPLIGQQGVGGAYKRKREEQDDLGEEGGVVPPTNDIYISRQQKRVPIS